MNFLKAKATTLVFLAYNYTLLAAHVRIIWTTIHHAETHDN